MERLPGIAGWIHYNNKVQGPLKVKEVGKVTGSIVFCDDEPRSQNATLLERTISHGIQAASGH